MWSVRICVWLPCQCVLQQRVCSSSNVSAALLGRAVCACSCRHHMCACLCCAGPGGHVYCRHVTKPCGHVKCLLFACMASHDRPVGACGHLCTLPPGQGDGTACMLCPGPRLHAAGREDMWCRHTVTYTCRSVYITRDSYSVYLAQAERCEEAETCLLHC